MADNKSPYNVVDNAELFPGACVLTTSGQGPFVDIGTENMLGERRYVAKHVVESMGISVGMMPESEAKALRRKNAVLRHRIQELEAVVEELDELKASVRKTLNAGAVSEKDGFKLRPVPGHKAVKV